MRQLIEIPGHSRMDSPDNGIDRLLGEGAFPSGARTIIRKVISIGHE